MIDLKRVTEVGSPAIPVSCPKFELISSKFIRPTFIVLFCVPLEDVVLPEELVESTLELPPPALAPDPPLEDPPPPFGAQAVTLSTLTRMIRFLSSMIIPPCIELQLPKKEPAY